MLAAKRTGGQSLSVIPLKHMLSKVAGLGVGAGASMMKNAASCKASTTWAFSSRPGTKRNGILLRIVVEGNVACFVIHDNSHWQCSPNA